MSTQQTSVSLPDITSWLHWSGLKILEAESARLRADNPDLQILGFELDGSGHVQLICRGEVHDDGTWTLSSTGRLGVSVDSLQAVHGLPEAGSGGLVMAGISEAGSVIVLDLVRAGRIYVGAANTPLAMLRSWVVQLALGLSPVAITVDACRLAVSEDPRTLTAGVLITDQPVQARPGVGVVALFRDHDVRDMVLVGSEITVLALGGFEYRVPYVFSVDEDRWAMVGQQLPAAEAAAAAPTIDIPDEDVTLPQVSEPVSSQSMLVDEPAPHLELVDEPHETRSEQASRPSVSATPQTSAYVDEHPSFLQAGDAAEDVTLPQVTAVPMSPPLTPVMSPATALEPQQDVTFTQGKPRFTATDRHIWVSVIGPIEVETPAGRTAAALNGAGRTDRTTELITRIALSPRGLTNDEIDETLWPEAGPAPETRNKQRNVALSKTRAFLGRPRGEDPLPRTGEVVKAHPDVITDWQVFCDLVPAIPAQASTEALARAIMLLRGQPLADAPAGAYEWSSHVRDQMLDRLADAALELSSRLERESSSLAMHAAGAGLKVNPDRQDLWAIMLRLAPAEQKADVLSRISEQVPTSEMTSELKSLVRKVKSNE